MKILNTSLGHREHASWEVSNLPFSTGCVGIAEQFPSESSSLLCQFGR